MKNKFSCRKKIISLFLTIFLFAGVAYAAPASDIADEVCESIVTILGNYKNAYAPSYQSGYDTTLAHGTGVIIKSGGIILTNAHVVKDIENITVILNDGSSYAGYVKCIDELSDLAIIKINKLGLKPVTFAPSHSLKAGDSVVAIGTPLSLSLRNSVSTGVVSGVDRNTGSAYRMIQTDAAINPGNSGGALIDTQGRLVGINSSKFAGIGIENIGFAIPVDTAKFVVNQYDTYGKVNRPDIGIETAESWEALAGIPGGKGLAVTSVDKDSIAETIGLLKGDVILELDNYETNNAADWNEYFKTASPNVLIDITVKRGLEEKVVTAVLYTCDTVSFEPAITYTIGNDAILVNGTTLVPFRSLSENIGAEVGWEEETQTACLSFKDVTIKAQINNTAVSINEMTVTMPQAPEIRNDITMIPLRFIAEAFGCDVRFVPETQEVMISREMFESDAGNLFGGFAKARIGDSYYNWSMNTPNDMMVSSRAFDGNETIFTSPYTGANLTVTIFPINDETNTIDRLLAIQRKASEGFTRIKHEISVDSDGNRYAHTQFKSREEFVYVKAYINGNYVYNIELIANTDMTKEHLGSYLNIVDSFRLSFGYLSEIHDLSIAVNGYRTFENAKYKFSCKIPQGFAEVKLPYKENSNFFVQYKYPLTLANNINISISSKPQGVSIADHAKTDYTYNKEMLNPNITQFGELLTTTVSGLDCVYYTIMPKNRGNFVMYDLFFYCGEYAYNFTMRVDAGFQDIEHTWDKMIQSIMVSELDPKETGQLAKDILEDYRLKRSVRSGKLRFEIPDCFNEEMSADKTKYRDPNTDTIFSIRSIESGDDLMKTTQKMLNDSLSSEYAVVDGKQKVETEIIGANTIYIFSFKEMKDGLLKHYIYYTFQKSDMVYVVEACINERYAGGKMSDIVSEIVKSARI